MNIGGRINERLQLLGKSQSQLGREVGVSQATIAGLISGRSAGSKHIHEIAKALATTPAYLLGEADDPSEGYVPLPSTAAIAAELGLVPVREIDLSFGMGATYLDVPVTETIRHFSEDWIKLYTRANPDQLLFAQGAGDSMFPTLLDSDLMLIDCSQRNLNMADKIWVAAYAGCGMIKRLRQMPDGGVKILSDNPSVSDEIAYDGELSLIGRVVAIVRKI